MLIIRQFFVILNANLRAAKAVRGCYEMKVALRVKI